MPLSCNPNARARFSLPGDANIALAARPSFQIKHITKADSGRHEELMDSAVTAQRTPQGDQKAYQLVCEALQIGITGWDNIVYPPTHEKNGQPIPSGDFNELFASGVLTQDELWTLAWNYPSVVRPVEIDLKNLGSRPQSEPALSAPNAAAAVA